MSSMASNNFRRPSIWTLPLARRTFLFSDLPSTEVARSEAFNLFCDAARRADNVGTDEMPSLEYFNSHVNRADNVIALYEDVTGAKNDTHGTLLGLLVILPCRYVRSCHPSNATLCIVTGESISSRLVWRDLARLGFEIATGSELHYTGCTIDVFVTCIELIAALREEGFIVTACIPGAGFVAGFPGRHIDSYVMYKGLSSLPRPQLLASTADESDDDIPDDFKSLTIPYLPVKYTLADGTNIVIRSMRDREEIRSVYSAYKAATASGSGFGLDELHSIGHFIGWYVDEYSYNLVVELDSSSLSLSSETLNGASSGHIILYMHFSTASYYSRSITNPTLSYGSLMTMPEFRGRGWGKEILGVTFGMGYDVGIRRVCDGTAIRNLPSLRLQKRLGMTMQGSIPRAIYYKDNGWSDLVVTYIVLTESFKEKHLDVKGEQKLMKSKI